MKVLHLISDLDFESGGPAKACVEMAKAFANLGHEVKVLTTTYSRSRDHQSGEVLDENLKIHYFKVHFPRFLKTSFSLFKALRDECLYNKPDIIHIHSFYLFHNFVGGLLARRYKIPYIIRPHSILDPYIRGRHRFRKWVCEILFENRNIVHASAIHFTAVEEMKLAQPYIFKTKGIVLSLGLNLHNYQTEASKGFLDNKFPELKNKRKVLFLGRINFKKGFDLLIPAFSKITSDFPDAHLFIVGPDSDGYKKQVEKLILQNNIQDSVTFAGALRGVDKLAAFGESEVFVLPSYSENFGISVVEAMACSLPVIISDRVNIWEKVQDYGAGIVVRCDEEEVSSALIKMLKSSSEEFREFGKRGRKLVEENYDWEIVSREYEKAYLEIIG